MAGVGISGSSSFASSSGSTNQSANQQRFSNMFGTKSFAGSNLTKTVFAVGAATIGFLMLKKKMGK